MAALHEIVTIQVGKYSNFVGAHWWNIQESSFIYSAENVALLDINHDVTFREGSNLRGEVTYTPRLVLIDSKDNFKSLRKECCLYSNDDNNVKVNWDGSVDIIKEELVKRNPFLEQSRTLTNSNCMETKPSTSIDVSQFEVPSTIWSDFLKTNLHPNSLCLLNELSSIEDTDPLELYSNGEEIYNRCGEEFEESLRKMTEDCDYLQGFQLICDAYNGFSGISNKIFQHFDDEYKKRPSICFPVFQEDKLPIQDAKHQMHRLYAILQSLSSMNSYCSFFSPLSLTDDVINLSSPFRKLPFVQYNENLLYHTSAILAAAIETLSSPLRMRSLKYNMFDLASSLSTYGRKLVCSSVCLPFPLSHDAHLSAMIEKERSEYFMTSLSPYYKPDSERTMLQSAVLRGVPENKFQRPDKNPYNTFDREEVFGEYLNKYSPSSITTATVLNEKCSVSNPFPKFFKSSVSDSGFLNSTSTLSYKGVDKIPVAASFSSSDSASQLLDDLLFHANKINFKEYIKCRETTFEKDSYHEVIESLISLKDNYTNY